MMGALNNESGCGSASASRMYCSTWASTSAWKELSKPNYFSEKYSGSVDCLGELGSEVVAEVGGVCVAVVKALMSSPDEFSAKRDCRPGPIRILRVCISSLVPLPSESVGDELPVRQCSSSASSSVSMLCSPSKSAIAGWATMRGVLDLLRVVVSVRCCIMKFLHRSRACWPYTVFPVTGSIIASLAGLRVCVSGNGSCVSRCVEERVLFGLLCVGMCFV